MKLRAVYDSEDKIPSEVRDYYEERDGKFYLMLEGVREHHEVTALSNAYKAEQTKRRDVSTKLTAAEARLAGLPDDFDATAYEDLKAKADGNDGKTVDEQVQRVRDQFENRIKADATKNTAELGKKDAEIARLNGVIERNVVEGGLAQAMDEANIDPKHKKKLAPYLRGLGKIKVEEHDGKPTAIVETDMGEVSLSKFVADWAASEDGKEYVGKPSGTGAGGSDGRKIEGNPFAKAAWSKTEQANMMKTDRAKAERLAKAAGFRNLDAAVAASKPLASAA